MFFIVFILVIFSGVLYPAQDLKFELVLCEDVVCNLPQRINDTFNTGRKIYAHLYLYSIENGNHKVSFYWYNPFNKLQESYVKEITVTARAHNIWSWLKLNDSKLLFDVSFLGRWKVKVYIDDKYLTERYFDVS